MKIKFDTTLERDIDLLLMEEMTCSPAFVRMMLEAVDQYNMGELIQIAHSVRDKDLGESDIVAVFSIENQKFALHIEDKISAQAMPNQYERYLKRIRKQAEEKIYDQGAVLMIAPAKYISANSEARKYQYAITYEQLYSYFKNSPDIRAPFKMALIENALSEYKYKSQTVLNSQVVAFCKEMNDYQRQHYPMLPIGTMAWWPYRRSWLPTISIIYKANAGACDLTFPKRSADQLYLNVKTYLSENMQTVQTGASASVRIMVPVIDLRSDFKEHITEVDIALQAIKSLYELSRMLLEAQADF